MASETEKESKGSRIFKRFFRASLSLLVAGVAAKYGDSPYYLALAPLLQTIGKTLRETKTVSLPF